MAASSDTDDVKGVVVVEWSGVVVLHCCRDALDEVDAVVVADVVVVCTSGSNVVTNRVGTSGVGCASGKEGLTLSV